MRSSFPTRNVLVFNRDLEFQQRYGPREREQHPKVSARIVGTFSNAFREMRRSDLDAIVLHVEGRKDMPLILRLRRAAARTPILALVPDLDPDLDALARESGADSVLRSSRDSGEALDACARALGTIEDLIQRSRHVVEENRSLSLQLQANVVRLKSTMRRSFDLALVPVEQFRPLLVEDSGDEALLLQNAFTALGLRLRLPVMKDAEEAAAYLSGAGDYRDRSRHPLPTLIITDLHLSKGSGLDVIRHVRSQQALANIVVFMFTSSPLRQDFDQALALGADSYFMKPHDLEVLREIAGVMAVRWGLLYRGR